VKFFQREKSIQPTAATLQQESGQQARSASAAIVGSESDKELVGAEQVKSKMEDDKPTCARKRLAEIVLDAKSAFRIGRIWVRIGLFVL
jgi:hypothetical protein